MIHLSPPPLCWEPVLSRRIILGDCWSAGRNRAFYQAHQTNLTSRPKGACGWPVLGLTARGGHLLDHSIAFYPDPRTTALAPPDKLTFDLPKYGIHAATTSNELISRANHFLWLSVFSQSVWCAIYAPWTTWHTDEPPPTLMPAVKTQPSYKLMYYATHAVSKTVQH